MELIQATANQQATPDRKRRVKLNPRTLAVGVAAVATLGAGLAMRDGGNESPTPKIESVSSNEKLTPGEIVNKNLQPKVEEFARALNSNVGVSVGALAPNDENGESAENTEGYIQVAMLAQGEDGREAILNFLALPEGGDAAPGAWKSGTIKQFDAKVVQPGANEQVLIEVSAEFPEGNGTVQGINGDVFSSQPVGSESAETAANNGVTAANDALGKILTFVGGKLVAPGGDI